MPGRAPLVMLAVTLALGACASAASERQNNVSNRDVLTQDQLQGTRATNAYEAVQRLRSQWLRPQIVSMGFVGGSEGGSADPAAGTLATVYLDDQRLGDVETLRGIEIAVVQYVRFFREAEAAARWGRATGSAPVIYVSTRPLTP